MFIHTPHVFARHSEKQTSPKCLHLRDVSIASTTSTASTMSFASSALSSTLSAHNSPTSATFTTSPTTATHHGPSSPASSHPDSASRLDFDPLMLHPTFGPPPPRLSERRILQQPPRRPPPPPSQPVIKAPTPVSSNAEWRLQLASMLEKSVANLATDYSPRHTIHTSTPAKGVEAPTDYFMFKMPVPVRRPELKSHWSESTIASSDDEDEDEDDEFEDQNEDREDNEDLDECDGGESDTTELQASQDSTPGLTPSETPTPPATAVLVEKPDEAEVTEHRQHDEHERLVKEVRQEDDEPWPFTRQNAMNMSSTRNDMYKRSTIAIPTTSSSVDLTSPTSPSAPLPRRPRMKTIDSVENFVKRGGWKRRGIVFQQNEARAAVAALVGD